MGLASPPLSKARRAAVHDYIAAVRRELYLQHWEVEMPDEYPDSSDSLAEIDPCAGRYVAVLRFGEGFWGLSQEKARSACTHELLHLHHVRVTNAVWLDEYKAQLGQGLYDHLWTNVKRETEYMVDALTTIVAPHVPLPKRWPA